ncbi:MAG TPA: hypothetical protein VN580_04410 [Clostridia bacterium]|nr:hypothetical protein [Clostridia bacterium]
MISFIPTELHIQKNSFKNQDFSMHIFSKYGILRSGFLDDVSLVFLKLDGYERNSEGIARFLTEIKLQISILEGMREQKPADRSIAGYYFESMLRKQTLNLNIYNRLNKEISKHESVVSYGTDKKIKDGLLQAYKSAPGDRKDRPAGEAVRYYRRKVNVYGKKVPGSFFYRPYEHKELHSIREHYRDTFKHYKELNYSREFNSSRELAEKVIAKDIISIGSQAGLKGERAWASMGKSASAVRVQSVYGRTHVVLGRTAATGLTEYKEHFRKLIREEKQRETNNIIHAYGEYHRNSVTNSRESSVSRVISSSRSFVERIITKDIESIGDRIALREERLWNNIYARAEDRKEAAPYGTEKVFYTAAEGRTLDAYRRYLKERLREERLRETNNNTNAYERYYRGTVIYSRENDSSREFSNNREYNNSKEFIDRIIAKEITSIGSRITRKEPDIWNSIYISTEVHKELPGYREYLKEQIREKKLHEINNDTHAYDKYHRDTVIYSRESNSSREFRSSREYNNSKEFIDRIIAKEIESIGSRITRKESSIWNSIYTDTVAQKGLTAYRESLKEQLSKEKLREVNNNTHAYDEYRRDTVIYGRESDSSREYYNSREFIGKISTKEIESIGSHITLKASNILNSIYNRSGLLREQPAYVRANAALDSAEAGEIMLYREYFNRLISGEKNSKAGRSTVIYDGHNRAAAGRSAAAKAMAAGQPLPASSRGTTIAPVNGTIESRRYVTSINRQHHTEKNISDRAYLKLRGTGRTENILIENGVTRNITIVDRTGEKLKLLKPVQENPLVFDREHLHQNGFDNGIAPPKMDNLKGRGNTPGVDAGKASSQQSTKAQVEIELPQKQEVAISKNQIDNIVNKVFSEIEKKLQFERYRRGL